MKLYHLENIKSGAKHTVNEEGYQKLKGQGWLSKYKVETIVVAEPGKAYVPPEVLKAKKDKETQA